MSSPPKLGIHLRRDGENLSRANPKGRAPDVPRDRVSLEAAPLNVRRLGSALSDREDLREVENSVGCSEHMFVSLGHEVQERSTLSMRLPASGLMPTGSRDGRPRLLNPNRNPPQPSLNDRPVRHSPVRGSRATLQARQSMSTA